MASPNTSKVTRPSQLVQSVRPGTLPHSYNKGPLRRVMGMYRLSNLGSKYPIVQNLGPRFPAIGF